MYLPDQQFPDAFANSSAPHCPDPEEQRLIKLVSDLKFKVLGHSSPGQIHNKWRLFGMYSTPRDEKALVTLSKLENLLTDITSLGQQIISLNFSNNIQQDRIKNSKSSLFVKYADVINEKITSLYTEENYGFIIDINYRICVCSEILAGDSDKIIANNAIEKSQVIGLDIPSKYKIFIQEQGWLLREWQVSLIREVSKLKSKLETELRINEIYCFARLKKQVINNLINDEKPLKIELENLAKEEDLLSAIHGMQKVNLDQQVQILLNESRRICPGIEKAIAIGQRFTNDFNGLFKSAESALQISILEPIIHLDNTDLQLIQGWVGDEQTASPYWKEAMDWVGDEQTASPYWKAAMESARKAEKALINQLAKHNLRPEDLSVLQIVKPEDQRWKQADILMSRGAWDVKNARRSYNSKSTYSEHCVPRFKIERGLGNVAIAGILSPYPDNNIEPKKTELKKDYENTKNVITTSNLDVQTSSRVWLGIVDKEIIERLQVGFKDCSNYLLINFRNIDTRGTYMPPWVFDYPTEYYLERDKLLTDLRKRYEKEALCLPVGQAILLGVIVNQDIDTNIENEAIKLQKRIQELGLSRPVLFLHVLARFCEAIHQKIPFNAAELRICLSLEFQNSYREDTKLKETPEQAFLTSRPLGVADPLKTIYRLIDVLEAAAKYCQSQAAGFRSFRLSGPGILGGVGFDGQAKTILAYCGGWTLLSHRDDLRVRCGTNPLYLGQNVSCPECGKLICHNCGFCTKKCNLCVQNQKNSIST